MHSPTSQKEMREMGLRSNTQLLLDGYGKGVRLPSASRRVLEHKGGCAGSRDSFLGHVNRHLFLTYHAANSAQAKGRVERNHGTHQENMVDDASGNTLARMGKEETIWAAAGVLRAWIKKYGVPVALYTDWKNVS